MVFSSFLTATAEFLIVARAATVSAISNRILILTGLKSSSGTQEKKRAGVIYFYSRHGDFIPWRRRQRSNFLSSRPGESSTCFPEKSLVKVWVSGSASRRFLLPCPISWARVPPFRFHALQALVAVSGWRRSDRWCARELANY